MMIYFCSSLLLYETLIVSYDGVAATGSEDLPNKLLEGFKEGEPVVEVSIFPKIPFGAPV